LPAATYTTPRVIDDICQREHYFYDTNPFDATFTQNSKGRLTAVQYRGGYNASASPTCDIVFTEMYSYGAPGNITKKRLRTTRGSQPDLDLDSTYAYDTEGRNTSIQYPGTWNGSSYTAGPNLGVEFDAQGRLNKLKNLLQRLAPPARGERQRGDGDQQQMPGHDPPSHARFASATRARTWPGAVPP
jgi:hypothetical protein